MFFTDISQHLAGIHHRLTESESFRATNGDLSWQLSDMIAAPLTTEELTSIPFRLFTCLPVNLNGRVAALYQSTVRDIHAHYFSSARQSAEEALGFIMNGQEICENQRRLLFLYFTCLRAICSCALGEAERAIEHLAPLTDQSIQSLNVWANSLHNRMLLRLSPSNSRLVITKTQQLLQSGLYDPSSHAQLCIDMAAALALCGEIEEGKPFYAIGASFDPTHPFLPLLREIYFF